MKNAGRKRDPAAQHLDVLDQETSHHAGVVKPDVTVTVHGWQDYLCSFTIYKQQLRPLRPDWERGSLPAHLGCRRLPEARDRARVDIGYTREEPNPTDLAEPSR
jgi:hypothetical protein